ncbi:MAG: transcription termination/antitermination NusG family protein [Victivallales bacterium]
MENRKFWTPVRTKPRQEKKLARYCTAKNIPFYLPLIHKAHYYGKKKADFSSPMFPGYVFCRINEDLFSTLQYSNAVVYKIGIDSSTERELVRELKAIRVFERMSDKHVIEICPELVAGTPIEISRGVFRGISGIVQCRKNKMMLIVNIELLGQTAAVEINVADVEKRG